MPPRVDGSQVVRGEYGRVEFDPRAHRRLQYPPRSHLSSTTVKPHCDADFLVEARLTNK